MPGIVKTISLTLLAIVITMAGLEFGVRVLLPQFDPSGQVRFYADSAERPALGLPNTRLRQRKNTGDYDVAVEFNRFGLRDAKDLARSSVSDWFAVGDSFSFGWGVAADERYSNRLQAQLGVPVHNISAPATLRGYRRLVAYAAQQGAPVHNLIVGVCMENDLLDYSVEVSPRTAAPPAWLHPAMLKSILSEHSAAYRALTSVVHQSPWLYDRAVSAGLIVPNLEGIPAPLLSAAVIDASVTELEHLAAGRRVVALIIPSRGLWVGPRQEAVRQQHQTFVERARQRGIVVVDPRDRFESGGEPLAYHFANDGHWRPAAHAVAAELLHQAVLELPNR